MTQDTQSVALEVAAQVAAPEDVAELVKSLREELHELRNRLPGGEVVRVPVTDAEFDIAMQALQDAAEVDLKTGNPKARPSLVLRNAEEMVIAPTKAQKALWNPVKKAMLKAYSAAHRVLIPERKKLLDRVIRNGASLVQTVAKTRKDGTLSKVSIAAIEPAKAKPGKGLKQAKPKQMAAKLPVAGNAGDPAKL